MRPWVLLILFVAAAAARKSAKIVSRSEAEIQSKLSELLTGLGNEDVQHDGHHEHQTFPYNDPHLYHDYEQVRNFTLYWNEGFLDKYDVFTITCHRTGRDTESLYYLFYNAKDFETFYKIANWAKNEVHPEMYVLALLSAISSRPDTYKITTPPLYEILPNYFVPSTVINQAYRAQLHGVDSRKFQVNNTGWDWSWHHGWGMVSPLVVHQGNRQYYDVESMLSYYREDVTRLDVILKQGYITYGLAIPAIKYPVKDLTLQKLGEFRFGLIRWGITRYNLERYALGLPPVEPVNFGEPIKTGYDPQIAGLYGRPLAGRPDNLILEQVDPEGVDHIKGIVGRIFKSVDARTIWNYTQNQDKDDLQDISTIGHLSNLVTAGDSGYYPSLYYNLLSLVDGLTTSSNKFQYSTGTLLNSFTMLRDPVYYQTLAYIDKVFRMYESSLTPYTKEQLEFPGVKLTGFEVSKLETYDARHEFDISNAVPGNGNGKYTASQFVIKTKPYDLTYRVQSDKEVHAIVKLYIGPPTDARNVSLGYNAMRESFSLFDIFPVKLQPGENVLKRIPSESNFSHKYQKLVVQNIKIEDLKAYYSLTHLPKGKKSGLPLKFYIVVHPYVGSEIVNDKPNPSLKDHINNKYYDALTQTGHSVFYPIDRPWTSDVGKLSNHLILDQYVYHHY